MVMETKFHKIFKKRKNVIIGVIHLPPLLGYKNFPGLKVALKNALSDLRAFEQGGVDGVIFENNYDIPHKAVVEAPVIGAMALLGKEIRGATKLPLGVNVLWNDYYASLSLAKLLNLQFIRIPVFVDRVKTEYGIIQGKPHEVRKLQSLVKADSVALFTDVHVKHAAVLSQQSIISSARLAIKNNADAIIVTGKWTGKAPNLKELKTLRKSIGDFPILIGSGTDEGNIKSLFRYANGAIVSTSLKKGRKKLKETNVKSYKQRIDLKKARSLIKQLKEFGLRN